MVERPLERKRESESEGRRLQTFRPERKRRGGRRDRGVSIFAISVCFPSLRFLSFSLFLRLRLRWAHCCNFPIVSRSRCFTAQLCWQSSYYSHKSARLWSVSVPLSARLRGNIVWLWHLCNLPVVSQSCFCCSHDILHMFVMLCVVSMVPWRFASLCLLSRVVLTLIFLSCDIPIAAPQWAVWAAQSVVTLCHLFDYVYAHYRARLWFHFYCLEVWVSRPGAP